MSIQPIDDGPLTYQELRRRMIRRRRAFLPLAVWIVATDIVVPPVVYIADRMKGDSVGVAAEVAVLTLLVMIAIDVLGSYRLLRAIRRVDDVDRQRLMP
jgi:hypothetical protein